ncbi:MAG: hypothetical protein ACR2JK_05930 [Geodermatophilaceae bacterium]
MDARPRDLVFECLVAAELLESGFSKIVLGITLLVLVVSLVARTRARRSAVLVDA